MWNKKRILANSVLFLLMLSLAYAFLEIGFTITTPFNISFSKDENKTYFLEIPKESYPSNITLKVTAFPTNKVPMRWWRLNDTPVDGAINGTNATDYSPNAATNLKFIIHPNAQPIANITSVTGPFGKLNGAKNFTRGDELSEAYFSVAESQFEEEFIFNDFSYNIWIDLRDKKTEQFILNCWNFSGSQFGFRVVNEEIQAYHNTLIVVQHNISAYNQYNWTMVTYTRNETTNSLYFNGVLMNRTTGINNNPTSACRMLSGQYAFSTYHSPNQSVSNLMIWDLELNQDDITYLYNNDHYENVTGFFNGKLYLLDDEYPIDKLDKNQSKEIMLNSTSLNEEIGSCDCQNCSEVGSFCNVPLVFYSDENNTLQVDLINNTYQKQVFIINEKNGSFFDVNNLTSVKLFNDENNSVFDFQTAGNYFYNYTVENNKVRLELTYADGTVINRFIDTDLIERDMRLCANIEGTTHYEQLITSSSSQPVIINSLFANCYVGADYTRFAYSTDYLLRAFTIDTSYDLFIYRDGTQTRLVGLDGGVQSSINIDTIQQSQTDYDFDILGQYLTYKILGNSSMYIYYKNEGEPNTELIFTITNLDDNTEVYSSSEFDNLDLWTVVFDYTSLSANESTLFKLEVIATNSEGTKTIKRYVNNHAKGGIIPSGMAITAAILLTVFGLTFTVSRLALSYFGLIAVIISIVILSLAVPSIYITWFMVIEFIVLIYVAVLMLKQNYPTLVG